MDPEYDNDEGPLPGIVSDASQQQIMSQRRANMPTTGYVPDWTSHSGNSSRRGVPHAAV